MRSKQCMISYVWFFWHNSTIAVPKYWSPILVTFEINYLATIIWACGKGIGALSRVMSGGVKFVRKVYVKFGEVAISSNAEIFQWTAKVELCQFL